MMSLAGRWERVAMGVGEMNKDQFTGFLVDTLGKAAACCRDGAIAFVFMDCPNEDRRPIICFHVDRLRWRSAESTDKMRRSLGSFIKSVCNTRPSRSSNGNGSK